MTTTRGFTFFYDPPRRRRASRVQRGLLVQCLGFKIAHVGYREVGAVAARAETSVSPLGVFKSSEFVTTATDENAIAAPAAAGLRLMPYSGSNTPAATGTPTRLYARAHPRFCRILPSALRRARSRPRPGRRPAGGTRTFPPGPRPGAPRPPRRSPPCPADRHPDVRRDERRRVVDSVAHHGDARAVRLGPGALDERRLVVGGSPPTAAGARRSTRARAPPRPPRAAGRRRARPPACPSPAAGARTPRHPADPVRERERADHALALDAHAHQTARAAAVGPPLLGFSAAAARGAAVPPPRPALSTHEGSPTNTCLPSTSAEAPRPGTVSAFFASVFSPPPWRRHGRRGGGCVVVASAGRRASTSALTGVPGGRHTRDPRLALRDGPRLVQRDDADVRGRLRARRRRAAAARRRAPADVATSAAVGVASPARRGTPDEASVAGFSAPPVAPAPLDASSAPGNARRRAGTRTRTSMRGGHHRVNEGPGDGVRQALHRRGARLRVGDGTRDSGGDAPVASHAGAHGERPLEHAGSRAHVVTHRLGDEQGLAGERRLVHRGGAGHDGAVHRDDFAGQHAHQVPGAQREPVHHHRHGVLVVLVDRLRLVRDDELRVQGQERGERAQVGRRARARLERGRAG